MPPRTPRRLDATTLTSDMSSQSQATAASPLSPCRFLTSSCFVPLSLAHPWCLLTSLDALTHVLQHLLPSFGRLDNCPRVRLTSSLWPIRPMTTRAKHGFRLHALYHAAPTAGFQRPSMMPFLIRIGMQSVIEENIPSYRTTLGA